MKLFRREKLTVSVIFVIVALIMTHPLIFNLNGFLLPQEYPDISHSDSLQHTEKITEARTLLQEGNSPVIVDKTDVSQIYVFLGLAVTSLGISNIAFHNLFFLTVLFLSGFFMYLFAKEITKDKQISFLAGLLYLTSQYIPYAYYWGHSNTMQAQWIPLIFLFTERLIKLPSLRNSLYLGLGLSLQILSGSYHLAHLSFAIPFYVVLRHFFGKEKVLKNKKFYYYTLLSLATSFVITSWYFIKKLMTDHSVIRSVEENMMDWWRLDFPAELLSIKYHLFMGIIQLILVLTGIYILFKYRKKYKFYFIFLIMTVVYLFCIMGPFSVVSPYYLLYKFWPYFDNLRVPFRMYPLFLMSFSFIAIIPIMFMNKYKLLKKHKIKIVAALAILIVLQTMINPWLSNLHMFSS